VIDSLSVVIAAYNEVASLPRCLTRAIEFLGDQVKDWEVIVVDDGSTDGTKELVDELARDHPSVTGLHLARNSGMGAALLAGYGMASKTWVTMLPGDGQIDPYEFPKLFKVADAADVVTSLYENRLENPFRRILSLGLRFLTVLIVGSRAGTEGTYLVRRDVLQELKPSSHSFLLNLEIPIRAKRLGYRVRTARIHVSPRMGGVSKAATLRRTAHTFVELFQLRFQMSSEKIGRRS
jgi:glycosyltransferase involved in cell wall biosynthesis